MSLFLTRNPSQPGSANVDAPGASQWQFIEKSYTTNVQQEWIYCPDRSGVSITLTPTAATASIECTDSPPSIIEAGTAVFITWPAGVVGATTSVLLQGFTAFRVNKATGTSVKISAAV